MIAPTCHEQDCMQFHTLGIKAVSKLHVANYIVFTPTCYDLSRIQSPNELYRIEFHTLQTKLHFIPHATNYIVFNRTCYELFGNPWAFVARLLLPICGTVYYWLLVAPFDIAHIRTAQSPFDTSCLGRVRYVLSCMSHIPTTCLILICPKTG